jgi:hypothetical protein
MSPMNSAKEKAIGTIRKQGRIIRTRNPFSQAYADGGTLIYRLDFHGWQGKWAILRESGN